jgi:hypothetical protein
MAAAMLNACGGNGDQQAPPTTVPPFPTTLSTSPPLLTQGHAERAAPRWEAVTSFSGVGAAETPVFTIAPGAIQWRLRWVCEAGNLRIDANPAPPKPTALVDGGCPGEGAAFSIRTGDMRLAVRASGSWRASVEQQVDTPINEPPLPGMGSAPVLAQGSFYPVEKTGTGTARIYRLPDGQRALRLSEDFSVFNNTDLVIWLSEAAKPVTSAEAVDAPHVELAPLKATRGPQNYIIPPDVPTERIRSIVLWCVPVPSVYIAAALGP